MPLRSDLAMFAVFVLALPGSRSSVPAPIQQQAMDQLADGLLTYNDGAEAEWALRDRLIAADVRILFRPIVVHALGLLRDEYSGISLLFRELKEFGLLKAEYERRVIAAGWRP